MLKWLRIFIGTLGSAVRTQQALAAENLVLRQQLAVLMMFDEQGFSDDGMQATWPQQL